MYPWKERKSQNSLTICNQACPATRFRNSTNFPRGHGQYCCDAHPRLGEIDYGVLRQVADYFFDIPSLALPEVVRILAEIEYVQLISTGPTTYKSVIPIVPHFSSVHEGLG